ncbi:MAG: DUF3857 domain-containing protein [Kordia sp.]|nr:MAG: DUF3857 domain-containing protein [Kordia sp.]
MIKRFLFLIVIGVQFSYGQENYKVNLIPEELKEGANAIIRSHDTSVEIIAFDNMIITQHRVITVLNRFGDQHVNTYEHYDDSRRIQKLSVLVLDAKGNLIKKYKKSEFNDVSAVSNGQLYMDNRVKHLRYHPISYPYTIIFQSTVKEKSTAFLNNWSPIEGYYVGLERSTYKLVNRTNSKYKFKGYNLENYDFKLDDKGSELNFSAENLKAVERENLSPDFSTMMPWVRFALNDFELKGVVGNGSSWKEFGLWQYNDLLANRDVIDDFTKNKITQLIADAPSEKEKIKRIYNYVQNNTRYVGVQLGIGGWQPIEAKEVDRVKYGDCKGLTNYTKALLKSQGIEAFYTLVFTGKSKKSIDSDFASIQGNHAFLCVPHQDDYIWLECTSQTIPFGFLGASTDDRDVLVITPEGGEIVHTPIYDESFNTFDADVNIILNSSGGFIANYNSTSKGVQYDQQSYKLRMQSGELIERYSAIWNYLNGFTIVNKELTVDKDKVTLHEKLNISVSSYVAKVGDKLLVPINPFNRVTKVPIKYLDRKSPFETDRSFSDTDSYEFQVPEEFTIASLPEDYLINSEFGSYKITIKKIEGNKIKYIRELTLKEGVFPKEKYKSYRDFIKKIAKKDKSKFILTKQS